MRALILLALTACGSVAVPPLDSGPDSADVIVDVYYDAAAPVRVCVVEYDGGPVAYQQDCTIGAPCVVNADAGLTGHCEEQ